MKNLDLHLSAEDLRCLKSLWKWKMLSTAALGLAAYNRRSIEGAYKRLLKLEKLKLIQSISASTGDSYVWILESLGAQLVQRTLPALADTGYKSEHKEHDFWVTAIHLGDWLGHIPAGKDLFSEQQLRRLKKDQYPEWVPRFSDHRPDGWWKINTAKLNSESLIALEVELSRKDTLEYRSLGEFYSTTVMPYQVIWVVRHQADIKYIHRHLESGSKSNCEEQSYLLLEQFFEDRWQSKIADGKNKGISLAEILGTSPASSDHANASFVLMDTRKRPINSISHVKARAFEEGRSHSYLFY